jgi:CHAT domain-containing protein
MAKFNDLLGTKINNLNQGILKVDFNAFTINALELNKSIFNGITLTDYKKLIICPESNINNLRFEALLTSTKGLNTKDYRKLDYLIHHIEIEYCLSPSFFKAKYEPKEIQFEIDAFAPFNSTLKLSKLPFSEKLANEIKEKEYGNSYVREKGAIKNFIGSSAPILHLSSHGLIDKKYSTNSALVLSDSLLTLEHVYKCNLKTQLVVLNNCTSSLGKYLWGDGVDGFIRAFHAKGVSNTLSNAWEVDDKQSNQLLENFFNLLEEGNSTISALRSVKQKAITTAANSNLAAPYYWAGHQLIGGGLVFEVEKNTNLWVWLLGFVGLIVVVYWFF